MGAKWNQNMTSSDLSCLSSVRRCIPLVLAANKTKRSPRQRRGSSAFVREDCLSIICANVVRQKFHCRIIGEHHSHSKTREDSSAYPFYLLTITMISSSRLFATTLRRGAAKTQFARAFSSTTPLGDQYDVVVVGTLLSQMRIPLRKNA